MHKKLTLALTVLKPLKYTQSSFEGTRVFFNTACEVIEVMTIDQTMKLNCLKIRQ